MKCFLPDLTRNSWGHSAQGVASYGELKVLEYWHSVEQCYPKLAQAALQLLCISTGSVDAEHSVSKMRKLQHPT